MAEDSDVMLGDWQDTTAEPGTDIVVADEPGTAVAPLEEPQLPATREGLELEAAQEGETNVLIDEMTGSDELTLADLRRFPQAKGLSDAELYALAKKNGLKVAGMPGAVITAKPLPGTAVARAWKHFGSDGKESTDLSKISAADFLAGKLGYRANQNDQLRTLDEVVRLAQLGHSNEQRLATVLSDRNQMAAALNQAKTQLATDASEKSQWLAILADQTGAAFLHAQEEYYRQMSQPPKAPAAVAPEVVEARGIVFFQQYISPGLKALNAAYPTAKYDEVEKVAQYLIAQEPLGSLSREAAWERIKFIVNVQLPQMLEEAGHARSNGNGEPRIIPSVATKAGQFGDAAAQVVVPSAGQSKSELMRLRAENANLQRAMSKAKLSKAPGLGRVGGAPSGEEGPTNNLEAMLDGKTSTEAREILRRIK